MVVDGGGLVFEEVLPSVGDVVREVVAMCVRSSGAVVGYLPLL